MRQMLGQLLGAIKLGCDGDGTPLEGELDAEQYDAVMRGAGAADVLQWVLGDADRRPIDGAIIEPLYELAGRRRADSRPAPVLNDYTISVQRPSPVVGGWMTIWRFPTFAGEETPEQAAAWLIAHYPERTTWSGPGWRVVVQAGNHAKHEDEPLFIADKDTPTLRRGV